MIDRARGKVVFLFDVDNTLLDNERVAADWRQYLARAVGHTCSEEYWAIFEEIRTEIGYADYLGALQRYRIKHPHEPHLLAASSYLLNYPFANCLFAGALAAISHVASWGSSVILSDGDVVFQPRKVERSGLFDAVHGRVLIYIHKERDLEDVERHYPADHYVLIDDKVRILTAVKQIWGPRVTTVFPRQGHYAFAPEVATFPTPDVTLDHIADLLDYDLQALLAAAKAEEE